MMDQVDKSEAEFILSKPTELTIVSGIAGSGKTTFCRSVEQAYSKAIYHDYWVEQQYEIESVRQAMYALFPKSEGLPEMINKANILKWITDEPSRNTVLKNFFTVRFSLFLFKLMEMDEGSVIVECPFLDDNISVLKFLYPGRVRIIWMNIPSNLDIRLESRGWDESRIARTVRMQSQMYRKYLEDIDEHIANDS